jgi:membrane protein DedA with SNARE-associated domain
MQWWDAVRLSLASFLDQHGVLAGFVVILIEETGVPVPIPGDFLMLGLGVHARQGGVSLWQALIVMEIATLIGASILYVVSSRAGRDLVYRYGRYIHLTPARLDQAERFVGRHGAVAIVLGRLTPGLRMATVIASGVFGVSPWRFLPSLAIGAFMYILAYTLLGYIVGPPILNALEGVHLPLGLLGSLVPLVVLLVWVVRARRGLRLRESTEAGVADRRHRWRGGGVAGGLVELISPLSMNVVIHLAGDLALLEPGSLVQRMQARLAVLALIRVIGPLLLLAAAPLFVLVGIGWGAFYAQWVEPRLHLPDWLSGLCFALLPLSVAVIAVLPVLDGAAPDLGRLGPLAAVSETLRHALYGAALGAIYPLRMARWPAALRRNTEPSLTAAYSSAGHAAL